MPIQPFQNGNEEPLTLVVQPWGDEHELPFLAEAGIRFTLSEGAEEYSSCAISERRGKLPRALCW